jgi:O-antigen ligase
MDPWGHNLFGPAKVTLLALGAAIVCFGLALQSEAVASLSRRSFARWPVRMALAFAALVCLSAVLSVEPRLSLIGTYPEYQGVASLGVYAIVGAGAAVLASRGGWWLVERGLVVATIAVGAYAIAQVAGFDPIVFRSGLDLSRARSTLGNASNLGLFLVLVGPFVVRRLQLDESLWWRRAAGLGLALGAAALILSQSRGAWAAGIAVALVYATLAWRSPKRRLLVGGSVLLVALTVSLLLSGTVGSRSFSLEDSSTSTVAWRLSVWRSAWAMSVDRPVAGWGPDTFRVAYPKYREPMLAAGVGDERVTSHAHNLFVHSAAELGWPAALALVGTFGALGLSVARHAKKPDDARGVAAPAAALGGALVGLQAHFVTLDTGPLLFAAAGLLIAKSVTEDRPRDVRDRRESGRIVGVFGWTLAAAAVIASLVVIAGAGLLVSDRALRRGFQAADDGMPWSVVGAEMERACRAAPWEVAVWWAKGRAATRLVEEQSDPEAFRSGLAAFSRARSIVPGDPELERHRAEHLLAGGLASSDAVLFQEALQGFERALASDSNNGLVWLGMGSARAGLGDWDGAVTAYERAVSLLPDSRLAWSNLAVGYEMVGKQAEADAARESRFVGP